MSQVFKGLHKNFGIFSKKISILIVHFFPPLTTSLHALCEITVLIQMRKTLPSVFNFLLCPEADSSPFLNHVQVTKKDKIMQNFTIQRSLPSILFYKIAWDKVANIPSYQHS